MTEHLSRYRIPPRVRDDALRLAVLVLLDLDDSGRERLLKLLLVFPWDGAAESDMREETIRRGRCVSAVCSPYVECE